MRASPRVPPARPGTAKGGRNAVPIHWSRRLAKRASHPAGLPIRNLRSVKQRSYSGFTPDVAPLAAPSKRMARVWTSLRMTSLSLTSLSGRMR
jgi:hypothetical protein